MLVMTMLQMQLAALQRAIELPAALGIRARVRAIARGIEAAAK